MRSSLTLSVVLSSHTNIHLFAHPQQKSNVIKIQSRGVPDDVGTSLFCPHCEQYTFEEFIGVSGDVPGTIT
ncbi:unnamed protein product [Dovyalis caffra]|uniref:Uncharacterized protein n=1 Tax=Dovyalis caffra TaxID=77055 RepID=A0AAV1S4I6_9ROSI|nr:unnamed protein product [Dovyalis caffra]